MACGHRLRAPPAHRGLDPEGLRLIGGGEHDPPADDHGSAEQARVIALLDGREERIEVGVEDRPSVYRVRPSPWWPGSCEQRRRTAAPLGRRDELAIQPAGREPSVRRRRVRHASKATTSAMPAITEPKSSKVDSSPHVLTSEPARIAGIEIDAVGDDVERGHHRDARCSAGSPRERPQRAEEGDAEATAAEHGAGPVERRGVPERPRARSGSSPRRARASRTPRRPGRERPNTSCATAPSRRVRRRRAQSRGGWRCGRARGERRAEPGTARRSPREDDAERGQHERPPDDRAGSTAAAA